MHPVVSDQPHVVDKSHRDNEQIGTFNQLFTRAPRGLPGAAEHTRTLIRPVDWTRRARVQLLCLPAGLGVIPATWWQPKHMASRGPSRDRATCPRGLLPR